MQNTQVVIAANFCARACAADGAGPLAVGLMMNALVFALERADKVPSLADVEVLGVLVEPDANAAGWRRPGQGDRYPFAPAALVQADVDVLLGHFGLLDGEAVYRSLLRIGPFSAGNERVAQIVGNWAQGTLADPVTFGARTVRSARTPVSAVGVGRRSRS